MLREKQRENIRNFLLGNSILRRYVLKQIVKERLARGELPDSDADVELFLLSHPEFEEEHHIEVNSLIADLTKEMTPVRWYEDLFSNIAFNFTIVSVILVFPLGTLCSYFFYLLKNNAGEGDLGACAFSILLLVIMLIVSIFPFVVENRKRKR